MAQDTGGEAAAGKWYDAAKATYTTLVDPAHAVSSAFQFINVPTGVWIDERGRSFVRANRRGRRAAPARSAASRS